LPFFLLPSLCRAVACKAVYVSERQCGSKCLPWWAQCWCC
jgi:hypothetical protein